MKQLNKTYLINSSLRLSVLFFSIVLFAFCFTSCKKQSSRVEDITDSKTKKKLGDPYTGFPGDGTDYSCNVVTTTAVKVVYDETKKKYVPTWGPVTMTVCYNIARTPGGYDGGAPGSSNFWTSDVTLYNNISGAAIPNINNYVACFNPNQSAMMTIHVDQPNINSDGLWSSNWDRGVEIGDAFIEIQQGGVTRVFGWYPTSGISPLVSHTTSGIFKDRSAGQFDVALTFNVPAENFASVLRYLQGYNEYVGTTYDFNGNNTAQFAYNMGQLAGQPLYVVQGQFPSGAGYGTPPAYLGQVLRYTSVNSAILNDVGGVTNTSTTGSCTAPIY